MKKTLPFLLLLVLLVVIPLSSSIGYDEGTHYYNLNVLTDLWGSNDTVNTGAADNENVYPSFAVSGDSSPNSTDFDKVSSEYMTMPDTFFANSSADFSYTFWYASNNAANPSVTSEVLFGRVYAPYHYLYFESDNSGDLSFVMRDSGNGAPSTVYLTHTGVDTYDTNWHFAVVTWNEASSTGGLWVDGVSVNNATVGAYGSHDVTDTYVIGARDSGGAGLFYNGNLDEIKMFNWTLNNTQIYNLYDYGSITVPVAASGYFGITASNSWNGSSINSFSSYINSSWYHTTNGTINTGILSNTSSLFNITLNATGYADRTYLNYNVTSDLAAVLFPSESVNITFRYINDTLILDEIEVTLFDSSSATVYNVTTGFLNLSLLSPDSYELRTVAINFTDRKYFFSVTSGSAQNITVYMFTNESGTELQVFHIRDTNNDDVTGAILRVEKETPTGTNLWSNFAEEVTNAEGKANTFLEKGINNYYRFAVFVNGTAKLIYPSLTYYTSKTNFIAGVSETVEIFIVLDETDITNYFDELYSVSTDMGFVGNDTVWFSWIDAQNIITGAEMIITAKFIDSNLSYVHLNTNTSASTSGNLSFTFTPINNTIYQINGYILYNDFSVLVESETHSYGVPVNVDKNWGLLLAIVILAVVAVLSVSFGVLVSSIFTVLILVFTNLIGFTNFPVTVITGLLALCIILFVKFNKGDK